MKTVSVREFVNYMQDALRRFHVDQQRTGETVDTFNHWWRRFHQHVRHEHPKQTPSDHITDPEKISGERK